MKRDRLILVFFALVAAACVIVPQAHADDSLRLTQTIAMPGIQTRMGHIGFDIKRQRAWVAAMGENFVDVYDLSTSKRLQRIEALRQPRDVLYLPDYDLMVVSCWMEKTCRFYNPETFELVRLADPKKDFDALRYDPKTQRLYAAYGNGGISVITPETGLQLTELTLGEHPENFALESKGPRIFINFPRTVKVGVINQEKNTLDNWSLPGGEGNFALALDEDHHRLFVAMRVPSNLVVLNTENGELVATVKLMSDCDNLFYDKQTHRVLASCGAGVIDVFVQKDPDRYELIDRIPTAPGSHTSLLVPESRQFFVAVPAQALQNAELRIYEVVTPGDKPSSPAPHVPTTQPAAATSNTGT